MNVVPPLNIERLASYGARVYAYALDVAERSHLATVKERDQTAALALSMTILRAAMLNPKWAATLIETEDAIILEEQRGARDELVAKFLDACNGGLMALE